MVVPGGTARGRSCGCGDEDRRPSLHRSGCVRGIRCTGEGGVELVGVRIVVLLGGRVVHGECIGLGGATDSDADHCFRLERSAVLVLV